MQIEMNEIESCRYEVSYEANALEIMNKKSEVINAFKKAPVPGFRQGKATVEAIKHHYKDQIEDSLKRALAEEAYHNTLFEKKIKPHGAPTFTSLFLDGGKFVAKFHLATKPEFELPKYMGLEIPLPHQPQSSNDLMEKMLQELRVKHSEHIPFEENDTVQLGDNAILDYDAFVDGVKDDMISAKAEMMTVGASDFPLFDQNIIGMKVGDSKEFELQAPSSSLPSIAGKTILFKVNLITGSKVIPCPLDDTLAQKVGKETLQEVKELLATVAASQIANNMKQSIVMAVATRLVNDAEINVPNWLSVSEAKYLAHSTKSDWESLKDVDKQRYIETAEKNVKLSLILDKIRENEPEAQLSDHEVFDMIKSKLAGTNLNSSVDEVIQEMSKTGYLQILFSRIKDEYALDFIVKNSKILE